MLITRNIAQTVAKTAPQSSDRYDQIYFIKTALIAEGLETFATDRETIDETLDILFEEYGFSP